MIESNTPQSRREFFRSVGRYAVLGIMTTAGALLAKRGGIDRTSQRCTNKGVCCNCGAYKGCRLPAALSAKQAMTKSA